MTHALKTLPGYFKAVESGKKNFEVRIFDRPFKVGEVVKGQTSNATGIVSVVQEGDWDRQVIPISDLVLNIYRIVHLDGFAVDRSTGLFSSVATPSITSCWRATPSDSEARCASNAERRRVIPLVAPSSSGCPGG